MFRAKVHHAIIKNKDKTTKAELRILKGWASYLMAIDHDKGQKYMDQLTEFQKTM